jgi:hypothetical protein
MKTIIPEELFVSQRVGMMEKHVDENNVRWYDFEKLVNSLNIKYGYAKELYNEIEDYNKDIFKALDKFGDEQTKRFITSEAMCKLLNSARESLMVVNDFLNAILKDEKYESEDYDVYEQQLKMIAKAIDSHNDKDICKAARQLTQTDVYKNTLDKLDPTFDREIEDAVDEIRDYLYNNEVNWILLGNDDSELFKLNKEDDVWSSWWSHEE